MPHSGHAVLYGSYKSTNGIAMNNFTLNLLGKERHVYLPISSQRLLRRLPNDAALWQSSRQFGEAGIGDGGIEDPQLG